MKWEKLGLVFDLNEHMPSWQKSHALMPVPLQMQDRIRVFYTGRNHAGTSQIGYVDLDNKDPRNVLAVSQEALFDKGPIGTFDDCGTVGTFACFYKNEIRLYYNGYNVRNTVPWSNSIGMAVSRDGGDSFQKYSLGPVMDRNIVDPYFVITPWILKLQDGWHMWYTSGTGWVEQNGCQEPLYVIKHAFSLDGMRWERSGEVCIHPEDELEANARSTVRQRGDMLEMWFCYRGSKDFRNGTDSYRIGYAEARVAEPGRWIRKEFSGFTDASAEYDSLMQAYPAVILGSDRDFMFYSGNGFGAEGICCAKRT